MEGHPCSLCNKTFGRQEHLRRHEQSHKDPQFRCDKCPKAFSRKDALNKHEQTHRLKGASLLQRGGRACSSCASLKSRCTGTIPCARCNTKKLQCIYPTTRSRSATADLIGLQEQQSYSPSDSPCLPVPQPEAEANQHNISPYARGLRQTQYDNVINPSTDDLGVPNPSLNGDFVPQPSYSFQDSTIYAPLGENAAIPAIDWTANALSTVNWLQSEMTSVTDDDLNNMFGFFLPGDLSFSPSIDLLSPTQQLDAETPGNDLLSPVTTQRQAPQVLDDRLSFPHVSNIPNSSPIADKATVASGEYYVDGDAGRLPRSKRRKVMSRPRRFDRADDMDFSLEYRFPTITCPDPKLMLSHETYGQLSALHHQLCLETMTFRAFLPSECPTKAALEGLLFNYFSNFDQIMPFLHSPTFTAQSCHWALLLAMMALGSCFVDGEDTETFTLSMHELVRRYLVVRKEQKYWAIPTPQTLAQIQMLHAIGAGYTQVDALRMSASSSLHQASKFCLDAWTLQSHANSPDLQHGNGSSTWMTWIKREEVIRTGFCIWLLDCMWAFHFQQPPHLNLDHATAMPMPCAERLWATKDVVEWSRLTVSGVTNTPTLLEALRSLYIDKRLLPNLGEFSCTLLIHGLFHRTWEVRATITQSLSSFEPSAQKQASSDLEAKGPVWPPSVPLFNRWRNSACDCLDILHWRANETIGAACGMEHPTVLHLHLARVILLAPMHDIIRFSHHLIRSSKDSIRFFPSVTSTEAEEHRRLIQRWALQDQYKARLAAIHAGVVLWHVRLYSVNAFYEPTAVAYATLLLWALGTFSTKKLAAAKPTQTLQSRKLGTISASEPSSPSPDVCDIILIDRPTDDELVQQFVRQGDNMHANITGVGDLFGPKGPKKVLAEGQKLLGTLRSWRGVTEYWLTALGRLEKVTARFGVDSNAAPGAGDGAAPTLAE